VAFRGKREIWVGMVNREDEVFKEETAHLEIEEMRENKVVKDSRVTLDTQENREVLDFLEKWA